MEVAEETRIISCLMELCHVHEVSKLIVLSSANSLKAFSDVGHESGKAFLCAQAEALVSYYAEKYQLFVPFSKNRHLFHLSLTFWNTPLTTA